MKTRTVISIITLLIVVSAAASAQDKWQIISSPQWGLSYKLPPGAQRQPYTGQPASALCELYTAANLAFLIEITPTASDTLASTAIEQAIQADMKEAAKLGAASRWEATSKQGDLFKGFTGPVQFSATEPGHAAIIKAIGAEKGVGSCARAALGDESSPVLKITVMGKADREAPIAAMAKTISSMVTRQTPKVAKAPVPPPPAPVTKPLPKPVPKPTAKPWPRLVAGKIELMGIVELVSNDGKTVVVAVDSIKMPGQDPIVLEPKRSKKVLLKAKMSNAIKGLQIRLIGRNDGVGKPITADAVELTPAAPAPEPKTGPPGPTPIT